ncbi:hypothetical protein PR048_004068 [Dryococelus australis]|uniref:Secreted protein n=1 Tax=Dryococelus australis TaxID=614101 RepID=A0ABQ9I4F8_9NEOP|nr:hypothetical protein PR048_004068 [Dryococelus australis]
MVFMLLCPWLLAIHCLSHCVKLSVKCYIHPSHIHQFQKLAEVFSEENVTSVPTSRAQGVRWVSHKKKCLDALARNYNVIVSLLGNWATGNKSSCLV